MEIKNSGDRLRELMTEKGMNPKSLAEKLNVSPQVLNNWFKRGLPARAAFLAAREFQVSVEWLETGNVSFDGPPAPYIPPSNAYLDGPVDVWDDETPVGEDEVCVPFLKEVELSAGSGRTAIEQSSNRKLRFGRISLRNQGVDPSSARCVTVAGNSMEPVLRNGATVAIDAGNTRIVDGDMYAIDHDGQLRVKQLYRLPGGGIRVRSFNRDEHPDEEYTASQVQEQDFKILGRVFWSGGFH
ncbi:helix-turn-helix transcriptional regulator [Pseudomonas extremaustralis]|uniref:LexA family transcriptional regulator n=1 Tax=Pseudomonas extremaustralis TaxID=359110 RepID=UPI002AA61959|nr:helix-turn-helix transcriptional regulator [Pseudomonas extremaustralis]